MSGPSLEVRVAPVEPDVIPLNIDLLAPVLLRALNDGDAFEQTTPLSLLGEPLLIRKGDRTTELLRGALLALPEPWPHYLPAAQRPDDDYHDLADQLRAFLAELDARGVVQIGAS